jgi:hypothetical protein
MKKKLRAKPKTGLLRKRERPKIKSEEMKNIAGNVVNG